MGTKSIDWRPGPTVCRCCLAEGCYKDISTEYFWMGKREVYSEMLTETFDINIAYSTSGPNSNSRLICEPCISRLRDAAEFKRQVHECEKTFMQYLDPGASSTMLDTQVTVEVMDSEVKLEQVKQEKAHSDEDDDDDFAGPNYPDDDDDDDDLDDQPLTKFATRVPKKESVDILDLLDNAKAAEKRKSTTKSKAPPPKKIKVNLKDIQIKPTASKTKSSSTQGKVLKITPTKPIQVKPVTKVVKKKKDDPLFTARQNAKVVLKYSTAYPFRLPINDMVCVYCCDSFAEPTLYREHMRTDHPTFKVDAAFVHISHFYYEYLKVDCTELCCRICFKRFDDVNSTAKHLVEVHEKPIDLSAEIGMQMFKFGNERWVCVVCDLKVACLRSLSRHMNSHASNIHRRFTCETCGKSYSNENTLKQHKLFGHSTLKLCPKCRKAFPDCKTRREHVMENPRCWIHSCAKCFKRFLNRKDKQDHMKEVHNEEKKTYKCLECDDVFNEYSSYRTHFVIKHTKNNFVCPYCEQKFDQKRYLEEHVVVHTKERLFTCTECEKSFPRKKSLAQHMWIHRDQKRFNCEPCKKKFNQRVSWRMHMKNHHPDQYNGV